MLLSKSTNSEFRFVYMSLRGQVGGIMLWLGVKHSLQGPNPFPFLLLSEKLQPR